MELFIESFARLHKTNKFVIPFKRSVKRNSVLSSTSSIPALPGMTNKLVVQRFPD